MNVNSNIIGAWTDARVALLRELLKQDLSAADIAVQLGGGLSRHAVIGKIARLGLQLPGGGALRPQAQSAEGTTAAQCYRRPGERAARSVTPNRLAAAKVRAERERETAARRAAAHAKRDELAVLDATELIELPPEDAAAAVEFMALNATTCRWPIGDPRSLSTIRFCGQAPEIERPYCLRHCRMAYRRPGEQQSANG